MSDQTFALHAVKYAHHERVRRENFIDGRAEEDGPMPLDYFVWVVVAPHRTYVVDTGFGQAVATARGRQLVRPVADGLRVLGVEPDDVTDVVITHLHYDHAGNLDLFPKATFHVQEQEMAFATGRPMLYGTFRHALEVRDVTTLVQLVFDGRVRFHDGASQLEPGVELHRVGGHTAGLQVVRVMTQRGWVVLASDASHFLANIETARPFPVVHDVAAVHAAFETIRQLADSPQHIVPGHDPLVLERYPASSEAEAGMIARLDLPPR